MEANHRQELEPIIAEKHKSGQVWQLFSRVNDAYDVAKLEGDDDKQTRIDFTMLARMYVAGSPRDNPVLSSDLVS